MFDHLLTIDEVEVIKAEDYKTLADWWCYLNHGNPHTCNMDRRWAVMSVITDSIGMKECLRCWNKEVMTDADFEAWWAGDMKATDAIGIKLLDPLEGNIKVKPEKMGEINDG
jgi:hypothetical protein